jgi:hypothetical protein
MKQDAPATFDPVIWLAMVSICSQIINDMCRAGDFVRPHAKLLHHNDTQSLPNLTLIRRLTAFPQCTYHVIMHITENCKLRSIRVGNPNTKLFLYAHDQLDDI